MIILCFNEFMEDLKRTFPFRWLVSQQLKILPCIMSPLVTL